MSIHRMAGWLLAGGLALLAPGLAFAQNGVVQPFGPLDVTKHHDGQPFAMYEPRHYGGRDGSNEGLFFTYDALMWTVSAPDPGPIGSETTPPVVLVSSAFRVLGNDANTGLFEAELTAGNRFEFGYVDGADGWKLSIFNLKTQNQEIQALDSSVIFEDPPVFDLDGDGVPETGTLAGFIDRETIFVPGVGTFIQGDGIDDDLDGDGIFGRNGTGVDTDGDGTIDSYLGDVVDGDDVVNFPVLFDEMRVRNSVKLYNTELSKIWRMPPGHWGGQVEWSLGARYFAMDEEFNVQALGGVLDESYWGTELINNLIGPNLGFRWSRKSERWRLSTEAKFAPTINLQKISQQGRLATNSISINQFSGLTQLPVNAPASMRPTYFTHTAHLETFAPILEFRLEIEFQFTKAISVKGGYDLLYAGGIGRASNVVDYTLPSMGIDTANNREDLLINGFHLGVSINR